MFSDLCLSVPALQEKQASASASGVVENLLQACTKMGYRKVAVERRSKGGRGAAVVAADVAAVEIAKNTKCKGISVFTRLTFCVGEVKDCQAITMNNAHVRQFDILAAEPTSEKTFQHCCLTADVDIISMDFSGRLPFYLKFNPVGVAITRGITFEVRYGHAISDSTSRQNFISNLVALIRVTKGRNIIVSSGASDGLGLRGPNDMINLMAVLGLSKEQAKATMTLNIDIALNKAKARRSIKGVMVVTDTGREVDKT